MLEIFSWANQQQDSASDDTEDRESPNPCGVIMYQAKVMSNLLENPLAFVKDMNYELVVLHAFQWIECSSRLAVDDQGSLCGAIRDVIRQKELATQHLDLQQLRAHQLTLESKRSDNRYIWD